MSVISVNKLGKRYRVGKQDQADTLSQNIINLFLSPVKNFRQISNLTSFKKEEDIFWALKDISFEVGHGDVLGIIGHNGAGKSTLLKLLSRITDPSEGEVRIKGRVSSLLEVGTGFHPELSGRDNIYMNGTILGMSKAEVKRKFDEIVEFSGVSKHIDTPVKFYSSGMKVRLGFSVAAHLEPDILIIDEVLAVGDLRFQRKCLGKIDDVSKEGRTILFVSHNMAAVQSLCNRGLVLQEGRIVSMGTIENAVADYIQYSEKKAESNLLFERADRKNGKFVRFKSLELFDTETNLKTNFIISGRTIKLEGIIHNNTDSIIKDANIGLAFFNSMDYFLFACGSKAIGKEFTLKPGDNHFSCEIPRFPISSGRLYVTAHCDAGNKVQDNVPKAIFFDVGKGDFYGTGRIPAESKQGILLNYLYE